MKQYTTFIDEAGNTGDNLLDLQQPLFVLSAVSVPTDKLFEAEKMRKARFLAVKEIEETEIKATKWYKAPRKQQAMVSLLYDLKQLGAQYHLVVTEKRFMLAGWAVNTFFDYANVGSGDMSFVNDINKRKATADHYEQHLSEAELTIVGQALRRPTREDYLRAIDVLRRNAPDQSSIDILICAERNVDNLLAVETDPDMLFGDKVFHSPNLTSLHALGNMIARMCKVESAKTTFIFDDCTLCNKAFMEMYNIDSNIENDFSISSLPDHFTWKDRVLSFETANSKGQPLLQYADILATSTDKVLQKCQKDDMNFNSFECAVLMLLAITFGENQLWMVTSQKLKLNFAKATRVVFQSTEI